MLKSPPAGHQQHRNAFQGGRAPKPQNGARVGGGGGGGGQLNVGKCGEDPAAHRQHSALSALFKGSEVDIIQSYSHR